MMTHYCTKTSRYFRWSAILAASLLLAGCDNANVSYGVGFHTGSYGWGNSFSVGITNHHYRRYPGYRGP